MAKKIKRLTRSVKDRKIAGVCGGIAEYFEADSALVRLGWIAVTAFTGFVPGMVAYVVAAWVIPEE